MEKGRFFLTIEELKKVSNLPEDAFVTNIQFDIEFGRIFIDYVTDKHYDFTSHELHRPIRTAKMELKSNNIALEDLDRYHELRKDLNLIASNLYFYKDLDLEVSREELENRYEDTLKLVQEIRSKLQ